MGEPLKETLFNSRTVGGLADCILSAYPAFDKTGFMEKVFSDPWNDLELKERMRAISLCLKDFLPSGYRPALEVLRRAAGYFKEGSFSAMVFSDFVEVYGLDDWDVSLPALGEFTCLCSSEFAVRPYLSKDLGRMMAQMNEWSQNGNPQYRRLSSEGSRPRLPWGLSVPALKADPSPILPILERLKTDESEMVRRSVANNLNDITKDHPEVVLALLKRWKEEGIPTFQEIASRALRSMIKDGDPEALDLMGFSYGAQVALEDFKIEPGSIPVGGEIVFSFTLRSTGSQEQNLVIDYVIFHQRANGALTPKVFKMAKKRLDPGESAVFTKKHSFREVTTRRYYPGEHALEVQVNGVTLVRGAFQVG